MGCTPLVVEPEASRAPGVLDVLGRAVLMKATGEDTEGRFAILEFEAPPMSGPPLHVHTREDEWFYVLEGKITFQVDGRRVQAGPGTSVLGPRNIPHAFQNFGGRNAHMLVMVTPAGFEEYFAELSAMSKRGAPVDPPALEAVMNKYGMQVLGPPLA